MKVWSLGWEDPLEKEMATHSSIFAWNVPIYGVAEELDTTGQLNNNFWCLLLWLRFYFLIFFFWNFEAIKRMLEDLPGSPVVKTLAIPPQRVQVGPLVEELRSYRPLAQPQKKECWTTESHGSLIYLLVSWKASRFRGQCQFLASRRETLLYQLVT